MSAVLGHIIVITVLAVIVFFCGRNALRQIKAELSGHATCAGCSKQCHGCASKNCASCTTACGEKSHG